MSARWEHNTGDGVVHYGDAEEGSVTVYLRPEDGMILIRAATGRNFEWRAVTPKGACWLARLLIEAADKAIDQKGNIADEALASDRMIAGMSAAGANKVQVR